MGLLRVDPARLDSRFLVYQYLSPQFQEFLRSKTIHGATVDRLAIRDFPSFPIVVPSLESQRQIVRHLSKTQLETQHLTALYQRKLAALDALKQSLLHQAFHGDL